MVGCVLAEVLWGGDLAEGMSTDCRDISNPKIKPKRSLVQVFITPNPAPFQILFATKTGIIEMLDALT